MSEPDGAVVVEVDETAVAVAPGEPAAPDAGKELKQTRVRIDTPGVTVEIEAHEPFDHVVDTALRVFHEAGGWPREDSRSLGFVQTERRSTPPVQPSSMPYGPGAYPIQTP